VRRARTSHRRGREAALVRPARSARDAAMPEELRLGGVLDSVEVPPRTRGSATRRGSAMASTASGSRVRSSASGSPSSTASRWRPTRRTAGGRSCTLTCHTSPSATTTATSRGTATTTSTATWRASSRAASRLPHSSSQARRPSGRRAFRLRGHESSRFSFNTL